MIQVKRLLSIALLLVTVIAVLPATAQDPELIDILENRNDLPSRYSTGYIEPPGWERTFQEHLKVFDVPRDLPVSFDWMQDQSPVKNQGSCGSCWAFAAIAEMESRIKIDYGLTLDLSEQQIISCNSYGAGCNGGWASAVYNVLQTYGGVMENSMPYELSDAVPCTQNNYLSFAKITGWHSISNNVDQIKTAIMENGPVCTAVMADGFLEDYNGTCYDPPSGWTDHLVLIVGWDDRLCDNQGAWIVKNSWDFSFGTSGYFNCRYGSAGMGSGVTQLEYTPPPVTVNVLPFDGPIEANTQQEINWNTQGGSCSTVDIWWTTYGFNFTERIAQNVPNDGSWTWNVPNDGTQTGKLCIVANGTTDQGYGFSGDPVVLVGFKTRFVSATGNNTPPYESHATAAHSITDAILACTGLDSVLVVGGDYMESLPVNWTVRLSGGWDSSFTTRETRTPTRIRGFNSGLRFTSGAGSYAGVEGFEFHDCQGAMFDQPQVGRYGGAIFVKDSSPYIRDCTFINNTGDQSQGFSLGGHIFAMNATPEISNNTFTGGSATSGGAIALLDCTDAIVQDNVFTDNSCYGTGFDNNGAALYITGGSAQLVNNTIQNNSGCYQGGGLYIGATTVRMSDSVISDNTSTNAGGGIFAGCGALELSNCIISNNTSGAGNGGGICSDCGDITMRNVTVAGNSTTGVGAGVKVTNIDNGIIENCLFLNNEGTDIGAGVFAVGEGTLQFRNNIVMGNIGGGVAGSATNIDFDYNNVYNNTGQAYEGYTAGAHDIAVDPNFDVNYELLLHSPCLDGGAPDSYCADPDGSRANIGVKGGPGAVTSAPVFVADATLTIDGDSKLLEWTPNSEGDISNYVIYAGTAEQFVPSAGLVVATISHPGASWLDSNPHSGYYYIVAVNNDGLIGGYSAKLGDSGATGVGDTPTQLAVTSVAPNPFNPRTTVSFDLPIAGPVELIVYDTRGRTVKTLVATEVEAGSHTAVWNGKDNNGAKAAAGVYLIRLKSGSEHRTVKVVIAK